MFGQLLISAGLVACAADQASGHVDAEPELKADLRADSNRDGVVNVDDDSDGQKTVWDEANGAVFLANIDDDSARCKALTTDDNALAACNDAQDDVVNGEDDALDLARLKTKPWPKTPDDATGHVEILTEAAKDMVRLFKRTGDGATDLEPLAEDATFTADELRAGVELAIEGKDIVRDPDVWDGKVEVQLTVSSPTKGDSTDKVVLRVAPVLTFHHLLPAEKIWVANTGDPGNAATRADLKKACAAAGLDAPSEIKVDDPWAEDYFETAYMSMPAEGGAQHVMRVNYRSANVFEPRKTRTPLRTAGQVVFTKMRGKDMAGVQQFDIKHDLEMDSLNSFGNLETVPPYEKDGESYPFGRVIRGSTKSFYPDPSFAKMIHAQGQQPEIFVDTSWLLVGHIDETTSFVKADTPRGWKLLVNDARLAKKMLEDAVAAGHGDVTMFVGKVWADFETGKETPAEISIKDVLANTQVMQASAEAAAEVDAQLEIIKQETGLTDDEIIKIPFLHTTIEGKSAAYSPGTVNGVYISDTHFGAPAPHGPVIDGEDIFEAGISAPLKAIGVTVDFIEDWDGYHLGVGEVHCGTNSTRKVPDAKWWESGR
jgi:protein-arginine deiminase